MSHSQRHAAHAKRVRCAASLAVLAGALATSLSGCAHTFRAPAASAPHALLKVRVVYHRGYQSSLEQRVYFNEHAAPIPDAQGDVLTPDTHPVRVPVAPLHVRFSSEFYHVAARLVTDPVLVPDEPNCTVPGGLPVNGLPLCSRYHTEYRPRTVSDRISDAACSTELNISPDAGEMYLLQYDFYGPSVCALTCSRQIDRGTERLDSAPCS